jgi:hypothetical protein
MKFCITGGLRILSDRKRGLLVVALLQWQTDSGVQEPSVETVISM